MWFEAKEGGLALLRTRHCCADGSRRAYYKEFVKVVAAADVIIEVLDARDPLGSRCQDVERFVRQAGADKKVILLLNKIGVSPSVGLPHAMQHIIWLKYHAWQGMGTSPNKCTHSQHAVRHFHSV